MRGERRGLVGERAPDVAQAPEGVRVLIYAVDDENEYNLVESRRAKEQLVQGIHNALHNHRCLAQRR